MESRNLFILALKELRDALLNKWFWLYTGIFIVLSFGLAQFGMTGIGEYGVAGFGRTAASLVNIVVLIVPLMGMTLGALSLASERERGTLLYLLTHPVLESEVLLGKYLGLGLAIFATLGIGFGLTGLSLGLRGGVSHLSGYLALTGFAILLAFGSLSLGFLISSLASKGSTAVGVAIFLWLTWVFLSDLGLLGASLVLKLKAQQLLFLALMNPAQVFKMMAIHVLRGGLEILGPAGLSAMRTFGTGLPWILTGLLVFWILAPLGAAGVIFQKRGGL